MSYPHFSMDEDGIRAANRALDDVRALIQRGAGTSSKGATSTTSSNHDDGLDFALRFQLENLEDMLREITDARFARALAEGEEVASANDDEHVDLLVFIVTTAREMVDSNGLSALACLGFSEVAPEVCWKSPRPTSALVFRAELPESKSASGGLQQADISDSVRLTQFTADQSRIKERFYTSGASTYSASDLSNDGECQLIWEEAEDISPPVIGKGKQRTKPVVGRPQCIGTTLSSAHSSTSGLSIAAQYTSDQEFSEEEDLLPAVVNAKGKQRASVEDYASSRESSRLTSSQSGKGLELNPQFEEDEVVLFQDYEASSEIPSPPESPSAFTTDTWRRAMSQKKPDHSGSLRDVSQLHSVSSSSHLSFNNGPQVTPEIECGNPKPRPSLRKLASDIDAEDEADLIDWAEQVELPECPWSISSPQSDESINLEPCVACGDFSALLDYPGLQAPCGHSYCKACVIGLVNTYSYDESLHPLRCCKAVIPVEDIETVLQNTKDLSRFLEKYDEYCTPFDERTYCPQQNCNRFIKTSKPIGVGLFMRPSSPVPYIMDPFAITTEDEGIRNAERALDELRVLIHTTSGASRAAPGPSNRVPPIIGDDDRSFALQGQLNDLEEMLRMITDAHFARSLIEDDNERAAVANAGDEGSIDLLRILVMTIQDVMASQTYDGFDPLPVDDHDGGNDILDAPKGGPLNLDTIIVNRVETEDLRHRGRDVRDLSPSPLSLLSDELEPESVIKIPTCLVCDDELLVLPTGRLETPCGHYYCARCARDLVEFYISQPFPSGPLRCCPAPHPLIPPRSINRFLDDEMRRTLEEKIAEAETPYDRRIYCPQEGCRKFVDPARVTPAARVAGSVTCPRRTCRANICLQCKQLVHRGVGCEKNADDKEAAMIQRRFGWAPRIRREATRASPRVLSVSECVGLKDQLSGLENKLKEITDKRRLRTSVAALPVRIRDAGESMDIKTLERVVAIVRDILAAPQPALAVERNSESEPVYTFRLEPPRRSTDIHTDPILRDFVVVDRDDMHGYKDPLVPVTIMISRPKQGSLTPLSKKEEAKSEIGLATVIKICTVCTEEITPADLKTPCGHNYCSTRSSVIMHLSP
ncbi:hypothetical protein AN958_11496 [Leucoagaricus sp. SymC.cos]|nr:hypothetical protein AN958_11496 [Leucoagaricus sp. SymC.cos]